MLTLRCHSAVQRGVGMSGFTQYYLRAGETLEELERYVNKYIQDGYQPLGAPVFAKEFSDQCLDVLVQLIEAERYKQFLASKRIYAEPCGFEVDDSDINPMLFPFQRDIVRWACKRGKAAVFAHTGLGKGPIQMEWCRLVSE